MRSHQYAFLQLQQVEWILDHTLSFFYRIQHFFSEDRTAERSVVASVITNITEQSAVRGLKQAVKYYRQDSIDDSSVKMHA